MISRNLALLRFLLSFLVLHLRSKNGPFCSYDFHIDVTKFADFLKMSRDDSIVLQE